MTLLSRGPPLRYTSWVSMQRGYPASGGTNPSRPDLRRRLLYHLGINEASERADGDHGFAYQPALDGMRALAVAAVLLFHGGVGFLPGGFLGVDAFFVLSGFLI